MMNSSTMRKAALIARDAHTALLELRQLVDSATQKLHAAELEMVGLAIGRSARHDPLNTLRAAAQTLQSSAFERAISQAKAKMNDAVAVQVGNTNEALKRFAASNS